MHVTEAVHALLAGSCCLRTHTSWLLNTYHKSQCHNGAQAAPCRSSRMGSPGGPRKTTHGRAGSVLAVCKGHRAVWESFLLKSSSQG